MNIAIVGCTGLVGRTILKVLQERNFQADNFFLFASDKSSGKVFDVFGKSYVVQTLTEKAVENCHADIALFSAGKSVSKAFAPLFAEKNAYVVDNSSAFRMEKSIPLIVPEVNADKLDLSSKIIANPNCSTIQAVLILKPLYDYRRIKRIVYSTYQAVSGAGQAGIDDLENGKSGIAQKKFPRQIYSECLPQVDDFSANGYTFEEDKMVNETRKILSDNDLAITATCVRVPVFNCHSESVNVEFFDEYDLDTVKSILRSSSGVTFYDDGYPTTRDANGNDKVFVGRVRRDYSAKNALNFWCVADNVRKGAATNAVQIAELIKQRIF